MSFRRFMYLVTGDQKRRSYLLRRIDTSRLFLARRERDRLLTAPPPVEEARLPPATMKFDPPTGDVFAEDMEFMLFAAAGRNNRHRVVAADDTGRALLYDPVSPSVRALPSFTAPKFAPVSVTVGDDLYVLDTSSTYERHPHPYHCFDGFVYSDDDGWCCHSLPPPPYVHPYRAPASAYHAVGSYAVVGGSSIWISDSDPEHRACATTYSFDTACRAWTKAGDWALPFHGRAHHVPEHALWDGGDDGSVCAADIWRDLTSPQWINTSSYLVHLGRSRFCRQVLRDQTTLRV